MKKYYTIQLMNSGITALIMLLIMFPASLLQGQIATTTPASRCGEGPLVLSATATTGTIKWYDVPFYGTPVGTGATFTTPSLAVTKTYYVDAVDGANCSLNSGSARVQVIATISANSIQAAIFYSSNTFCKSASGEQLVTRTGTDGGVFTASPSGLTINALTGAITPGSSTSGSYTVTYTVIASEGCTENPASTDVTITDTPVQPEISYSGSPYCTTSTPVSVSQTGAGPGIYSASPSGLTINTSDGTITPASSSSGTYTITYFVPGAGGCDPQTATTSVTITGLPTAVITYTGAPYCMDISTAQTPQLTGTGAYTGGTYSYTGGTLNSFSTSTGAFIPGASTAGTYTIYYTAPASGNCATVVVNTPVTINILSTASITGTTTVCQNAAEPNITFTGLTGTSPFTFTYTVGAGGNQTVTTTSGSSVSVAQPTVSAGTYQYSLISVSDANGCTQTASGTATITVSGTPVADFSYVGSPFCKTGSVSPTFAPGGTAGTFSATGVTFVSTATGEINLSATPAGNYTITNTISTCGPVIATSDITINALPTAIISGTTACGTSTLTVTTNATTPSYLWYKDNEVIVDQIASTLIASANGDYTVKVTDGSTNCAFTSTAHTVTLIPLPTASITGTLTTCNAPTTLTAVSDASSPTYVWYKNDEVISGQTDVDLIVDVAMGTGDYKVKIRNGSTTCENTSAASFVTIGLIDDPGTVGGGQTVCSGVNTTTLELTGTKSTVLRWESSVSPFNSWTPISNISATYTATGLTQTTKFRAAVQNGICPVAFSDPATVTVVPDPNISVQPAATTSECIGGTAQLSVTAVDGTPSLNYQWYTNATNNNTSGTLIQDATASTYTPPTVSAGTVYYYVIVSASGSGCGTAISNVAAVTTVATSPTWTSYNLTPTSICDGGTVTFGVSVTGGTGGTISWIRSEISGGAGATVTTGDTPPVGTWYYRPHYTPTCSGCTLADGTQTTVTVNPLPTIATSGTIAAVTTSVSEQTTTLAYTATTNTPVSYSINWGTLTDQNTTTITFQSGAGSVTGIKIPAGTTAGVYTGTMTITTANGCTSTQSVSVSVAPKAPTGSTPQTFCSGI